MFAAKKIVKEKDVPPEPFEMDVAQALCDLEANSNDLKAELRELYIVSAKEVDVTGRKAVVIFVPFKLLKVVHKIQSRLVREVRQRPPPSPPHPLRTPGTPTRLCHDCPPSAAHPPRRTSTRGVRRRAWSSARYCVPPLLGQLDFDPRISRIKAGESSPSCPGPTKIHPNRALLGESGPSENAPGAIAPEVS